MVCVQRRRISPDLTSTSERTVKSDLFLTRAIPSSLRDTGHPDKELVLMAITYALTAFKDANTMTATDATIAKHVHDALVTFEEKVFKPHLSKEDEDWNALKVKADRALPVVVLGKHMEFNGFSMYNTTDERDPLETGIAGTYPHVEGEPFRAEYRFQGSTYTGTGDTADSAIKNAVLSSGGVVA